MNPGALWHPAFWLPQPSDSSAFQSVNEWMVATAVIATLSGLYNPAEGIWIDVFALRDIDYRSPAGFSKLRGWLAGESDTRLDGFDLSAFVGENLQWGEDAAVEMLPTLSRAAWAFMADDLADSAAACAEAGLSTEQAAEAARQLAGNAVSALAHTPIPGGDEHLRLWRHLSEPAARAEVMPTDPLAELGESLRAVRADCWPFVEMLSEESAFQNYSVLSAAYR